jgi:hypothetical protein
MFNWIYCKLEKKRLIDTDTDTEVNTNFPDFKSTKEAETYIIKNDLRITLI